jgi:hypothetical protein
MPNNSHNSLGVTPGTLLEMSETLQIPCCLPGELRGKSVVDAILEIQENYAHEDDRPDTSDNWFRRLKCLSVYPGKEKALKRSVRNPENFSERDYIAVSYSFESAHESLNKHTLDFEIHGPGNKAPQKFKTRDIVLERVLKYAKSDAVRCQYFWIDQECFDQNNPEEHQAAMDSMDLVYKHSDFPVALLEITFGPREVYLMGILVFCDCVWPSKDDSMVAMLRHVQTDRWWQRAWTFQEEYLASTKMDILIRHNLRRGTHIDSRLGCIEGEVCVSAIEFRERSTNFLSKLIRRNTTSEELRKTCMSLRRTFHRYNETTEPGMGKAMSSIVFGDLERRKMSKSYDFLPIAANVCDYRVRLRSDQLAELAEDLSYSVGLCALAMYLLNGEIIHHKDSIANPAIGVGLSEYLDTICFNKLRSPPTPFELSWFKMCRLHPVRLSSEGIITRGHVWHVQAKLVTSNWKRARFREPQGLGLNEFERDRLLDLMDGLKQFGIYEGLWQDLDNYLAEEARLQYPPEWPMDHMNLMAKEIVDAICGGRNLYVATLEESPEAFSTFSLGDDEDGCSEMDVDSGASDSEYDSDSDDNQSGDDRCRQAFAIFAMGDDEVAEGKFCVFTSTSRSHRVSMTVKMSGTTSESKLPLMTITGWINGLAFYDGKRTRKTQETVVRLPEAWHRKH